MASRMEMLAQKIDNLERLMSKGFGRTEKLINGLTSEIDLLAASTAREFTAIRKEYATKTMVKNDLEKLRKDIYGDINHLLDKHIGAFRKDYDSLAERRKTLELKTAHLPDPST